MAADFTGKTALITGAGRGIGRAIALGLADGGVGVILLARTAGQLDETSALVNNAATVEPLGPTTGIAAADLRLAFEVNVIAPAELTAAVLPACSTPAGAAS